MTLDEDPKSERERAEQTRSNALPDGLSKVLPPATERAWLALATTLPQELYLGGGTAVAVHLRHRESRDLDFFYHRATIDLKALAQTLSATHTFAVTYESAGTLRGLFGETKVEFLHADEQKPQHVLDAPETIAGLRVAGLKDLMAMKLAAIGGRGEMRDYYDVKTIEEQIGLTVEDGIALFIERYDVAPGSQALVHLVEALGYLDDLQADDSLPIGRDDLLDWWHRRQARVVRNLSRNPL
jgi:hypothetical protein